MKTVHQIESTNKQGKVQWYVNYNGRVGGPVVRKFMVKVVITSIIAGASAGWIVSNYGQEQG